MDMLTATTTTTDMREERSRTSRKRPAKVIARISARPRKVEQPPGSKNGMLPMKTAELRTCYLRQLFLGTKRRVLTLDGTSGLAAETELDRRRLTDAVAEPPAHGEGRAGAERAACDIAGSLASRTSAFTRQASEKRSLRQAARRSGRSQAVTTATRMDHRQVTSPWQRKRRRSSSPPRMEGLTVPQMDRMGPMTNTTRSPVRIDPGGTRASTTSTTTTNHGNSTRATVTATTIWE